LPLIFMIAASKDKAGGDRNRAVFESSPSANRKLARNGLPGSGKRGCQGADKSQLSIAESRIVIALHSPNALIETGPRECSPEKRGTVLPSLRSSAFSAVRFLEQISRQMGILRVFGGTERRNFSAVKTCWRRERDSHPRYHFEKHKTRSLRKLHGINSLTKRINCLPILLASLW
jgi:hypothetical protein